MTTRQSSWAAAALYLVLTLLLAYPLSVTANRTLPSDDPDGHLFMWTLAWDVHAFVHQPLTIFDANIFYPLRDSLALSENLIGSAFFAAPVLWLTANPVLAVNVVSLLSCVLCGLGAYVLGRRLGLSAAASVLTGLIFAFSPPRFFRFSQLHLTAVQWIPFTLASLHAYVDGGNKRDLRLAIVFFTLQVLASGHGGVFTAVAVLLLLTCRLALGEPLLAVRRLHDVGLGGALLLVPVALLAIPYRINQVELGLRRVLDTSTTPIENFFASPTRVDGFLQSLFTSRNINSIATAWLFPGFLPVALAIVAVIAGGIALVGRIRPRAPAWPHWAELPAGYRLPLRILAIAALAWACLGLAPLLIRAGDGLTPLYYANGRVVWSGYLNIDQGGRYDFGTTSNGGSRLLIDSQLVIDHGADRPDARTGSMLLDRGAHRILLEYNNPGDQRAADLSWASEGDGGSYEIVPSWALSRRPVSYSTTIVLRRLASTRAISAIVALLAALWVTSVWLMSRWDAWTAWTAPYRRQPTMLYLVLVVVCIMLAIGPPYGLWQFVYWLPGFNFIRGASRFMVLGLLGVAVLAGVGFDWLTARLAPTPRRLTAVLVGALLVAEFSAIPFGGVPYRLQIPAADQWVARQPKPFSIAEVPVTSSERYHSNYMLHSMAHWQKTVNGYSGILPDLHEQLYNELRTFPSDKSIQHLAQLDVTYVIVHSSWFAPDERAQVEERLLAFGSWLKLEFMDADSRVYSVRHSPQKES